MATVEKSDDGGSLVPTLVSVLGGISLVIVSLLAFRYTISDQATEAARLARMQQYVYWSQPFIYVLAGLLAASGDVRRALVRAPVVGVFLGSMAFMALRRQDMLPSDAGSLTWLLTAGALFTLGGALLGALMGERTGTAAWIVLLLGIGVFIYAYLNLGSVSGIVQREVIQRAQGMTMAMTTEPVPDALVQLVDPQTQQVYYVGRTNSRGRFLFSHLAKPQFVVRVQDPLDRSVVISQEVRVEPSITGGTRWVTLGLPSVVRDAGRIFE